MKILLSMASVLAIALLSASVWACGIEGSATRSGSDVNGTVRVSTSWNSSDAFPRGGYYNLDLGSGACGESVEVFVNGYSIGRRSIPSSGNARVDFTLTGQSDKPDQAR
ncbi:MAG: DUF4982 domain-containing protein [Deltaproteobacteria bacterium]|jgi:hypothetical protein|nr:DUF4982 domain-containing protein [Deltaproteobacteria bacterium]